MKDIDEVRRAAMRLLEKEAGSVAAAAKQAGMSYSQWVNLRSGAIDSKTGKPRGMRKETARKIEAAFGKTEFWLDIADLVDDASGVIPFDSHDTAPDNVVLVREYTLRLSGGPGSTPLLDEIEESRAVPFMRDWLREKGIPPNKAKRFKVKGDSMVPTVGEGDTVLVDTSDTKIRNGRVYALSYGDDLRIKRLFTKLDGTLILHSDNPDAVPRDEELPPELAEQYIRIIGRVRDRSGATGLD